MIEHQVNPYKTNVCDGDIQTYYTAKYKLEKLSGNYRRRLAYKTESRVHVYTGIHNTEVLKTDQ